MSHLNFGFIGAGQISHYSAADVHKHPRGRVVAAQENNRSDVHLYGTEGGTHALSGKLLRHDSQTGEYLVVQSPRSEIRFPHGNRFHNLINHLHEEEELCVTLEQALVVQRILDALNESAATGREVRLDS